MSELPYGPRCEKTCLWWFANNKGADQPVLPSSLISTFVICVLESSIPRLATNKISFFYLVSVAEQAGLSLTLWETPKTGFLATRPIFRLITFRNTILSFVNSVEQDQLAFV